MERFWNLRRSLAAGALSPMGVPAFFMLLIRKYPDIMLDLPARMPGESEGDFAIRVGPLIESAILCDNLYLDCNGIIHPCCHPEGGKPQPKTEDEMFANVAALLDEIVELVRPRHLLYLAIDGVAPRAKMNQQRSRRFRSAKETSESAATKEVMRERFRREGLVVPPADAPKWDRNVITPGTPFMERLARFLRHFVAKRLHSHPLWRGLAVVISDAGVPGEGEHKLIEFIRTQRTQPREVLRASRKHRQGFSNIIIPLSTVQTMLRHCMLAAKKSADRLRWPTGVASISALSLAVASAPS